MFFFPFVKFYEDVTQKVVEITDFRKMSQEGMRDAFHNVLNFSQKSEPLYAGRNVDQKQI